MSTTRIYLSPSVSRLTVKGTRLVLSEEQSARLRAAEAHEAYKLKREWARGAISSALAALEGERNPFQADVLARLSAVKGYTKK